MIDRMTTQNFQTEAKEKSVRNESIKRRQSEFSKISGIFQRSFSRCIVVQFTIKDACDVGVLRIRALSGMKGEIRAYLSRIRAQVSQIRASFPARIVQSLLANILSAALA